MAQLVVWHAVSSTKANFSVHSLTTANSLTSTMRVSMIAIASLAAFAAVATEARSESWLPPQLAAVTHFPLSYVLCEGLCDLRAEVINFVCTPGEPQRTM
jgi:hypothetical protein